MKTSLSLTQLAEKITERADRKEDMIADTRIMEMVPEGEKSVNLQIGSGNDAKEFQINPYAHGQIAEWTGIPSRYYEKMRAEQPELLTKNVNTWFQEYKAPRMVRTLEGTARAFLSDKYYRLDDDAFAEIVLPVVLEQPGAEIVSCTIEPTKTFIKFKSTRLERQVKVGDLVQFGVAYSNSEVGAGRLTAALFAYQLRCTNGMVMEDEMFAQTHLTGKQGGRNLAEIFKLDTVNMDAKATILKLRDFTRQLLDPAFIDLQVEKMRNLTEVKIAEPVKAVETLAKTRSLSEGTKNSVLKHLIEGGDLSMWGLQNAVTRAAEDEADYTEATRLEAIGGKMLTLGKADYRELALAA